MFRSSKISGIFLLIFFVLFSAFSFSQINPDSLGPAGQRIVYEQAAAIKNFDERLTAVNNLLLSKKITECDVIASLYNLRATTLNSKYSYRISRYNYLIDSTGSDEINQVLKNYQTAMDTCPLYMPAHLYDRWTFLGSVNPLNPQYNADLQELKKYGYKEEKNGVGFGANYLLGRHSWLGFEISTVQMAQGSFWLKNADPKDGKKKKVSGFDYPVGVSVLTLGINKDFSSQAFGIVISLVQVRAPVLFDPTKLCFTQNDPMQPMIFSYRPEIGVGNAFLHIGYAYNFVFKKSEVSKHETHMLVVRLSYPLIRTD